MSLIAIGKAGHRNLTIDLSVLVRTRALVQAASGQGKSVILRIICERAFGKIPVLIVDSEGEFHTLREKFGYLLAGPGGEAAADPRLAYKLAQKLLEYRASAVCDIYELAHQRHEWVRNFLTGLMEAPKKWWRPTLVIVDEAHKWAPEGRGAASVAADAMIDLESGGRKHGLCAIFATQRLSKLRRDATADLLNRIIGGTFEDLDIDRAGDELSVSKKDREQFSQEIKLFEPGEFFAIGRAISRERIRFKAAWPTMTTHPEAGSEKFGAEPPPLPDKIKRLLPQIADLPQEAEKEARTVNELRTKVRELQTQIRSGGMQKVQPTAAKPENREREIAQAIARVDAAVERAMKRVREHRKRESAIVQRAFTRMVKAGAELEEAVKIIGQLPTADELPEPEKIPSAAESRPLTKEEPSRLVRKEGPLIGEIRTRPLQERPQPAADGNDEINRRQRDILKVLAEFNVLGRQSVSRKWIAARAGVSHKSSGYDNNLGRLRSLGLVKYVGAGEVALTSAGEEAIPRPSRPLSSAELLESCLHLLNRKQRAMLQKVYDCYPESTDRITLAEASEQSPNSSGYDNNLGMLRSAGMIEYVGNGAVKCADWILLS